MYFYILNNKQHFLRSKKSSLSLMQSKKRRWIMENVIIKCSSAEPLVPSQWHLLENRFCRDIEPEEIIPLVLPEIHNYQVPGHRALDVIRALSEYEILNNVPMRFFLENPGYIPIHLVGMPLIFIGTLFDQPDNSMHAFQMCWLPGNKGFWPSDLWLDKCLGLNDPIAVVKKQSH